LRGITTDKPFSFYRFASVRENPRQSVAFLQVSLATDR
jgi:hypothetical protein